jgi:hypothetical protein
MVVFRFINDTFKKLVILNEVKDLPSLEWSAMSKAKKILRFHP